MDQEKLILKILRATILLGLKLVLISNSIAKNYFERLKREKVFFISFSRVNSISSITRAQSVMKSISFNTRIMKLNDTICIVCSVHLQKENSLLQ